MRAARLRNFDCIQAFPKWNEWQWDEVTEMKRAFWIFITGALLLLLNLLFSVTLPHLKAIAIGLTAVLA